MLRLMTNWMRCSERTNTRDDGIYDVPNSSAFCQQMILSVKLDDSYDFSSRIFLFTVDSCHSRALRRILHRYSLYVQATRSWQKKRAQADKQPL
jgi:hypothetical protein